MTKIVNAAALRLLAGVATAGLAASSLPAQTPPAAQGSPPSNVSAAADPAAIRNLPWMNATLDPDRRAALALAAMTQDEKILLVHGTGGFGMASVPAGSNGGAGYVPGIPRLGLPALDMADSTVGVTRGAARSRYSTWMPATVAEAATWDPAIAYDYGALIGRELRAQGYNVSLAGGVNVMREPRGGRTFEYRGEDSVLSGVLAGQFIRGLQDQKIIGDIKHYAFNDQETGRHIGDVGIGEADGRESDLLAFEIGIRDSDPGMVMCAYNKVNTHWACENDYLLNQVLKRDWGYKGFVLSDWGGTHSTVKAALAGLDQEQPGQEFFGAPLAAAITGGGVPQARLDDAVRRILRTMFAFGVVDNPPVQMVVDVDAGLDVAQRVAERGMVLLKNDGVLPIAAKARSIVLVGGHADVGLLTGGGSGQVDPPGGNAVDASQAKDDLGPAGIFSRVPIWYRNAPLKAIAAAAPQSRVTYVDGTDPAATAAAVRGADLAIVFAVAPASEGRDLTSLSLPGNQDALIAGVAAANPNTIVVLETGGPVTMPWLNAVKGVVQAWFAGARGSQALAGLLTGKVNFSGKLPFTFPRAESDLPNREVPGLALADVQMTDAAGKPLFQRDGRPRMSKPPFRITYPEGADVGYRWFARQRITPLFAFGHGLSYTTYAYSGLTLDKGSATFTVSNTGQQAGTEIAQVYAKVPGRRTARLAGWTQVTLAPGERRQVTVKLEPLAVSTFVPARHGWQAARTYDVTVGGSSASTPLRGTYR